VPDGTRMVGVVRAPVTTTHARRRWWGLPTLALVLVVGGAALVFADLRGGPGSVPVGTVFAATGALAVHQVWRRASVLRLGTTVPVRRFPVQVMAGTTVACVLDGELAGDGIVHGDIVRFAGRGTRDGQLMVRRLDVLATPSGPVLRELATRRPVRLVAATWGDRMCFAAAGLAGLWSVLVLTGLVA
jgi:hypothetical protein